eukprot:m.50910 g.50910  ORF g.50910 m.50910 type:complete len:564 (-) comp10693_c0_seq1:91-1782(-)
MSTASLTTEQDIVYQEQLSEGKSKIYALEYASQIFEGGQIFARHFATLREKRYAAKVKAAQALEDDTATTNNRPTQESNTQEMSQAPIQAPMAPQRPTFTSTSQNVAKDTPITGGKKSPDDFVLIKTLGVGSFSTVHLAQDKNSDATFAIKILEKAHIVKEKKEKYVMTEKDCFNQLHFSPFIIKLFYTFQDKEKLYFVLEYASNGELLSWLKKLGSFDEECTRFYASEIILALEHMHSKDIIHRDLKPENILLDEKMHLKICDFGTAKQLVPQASGRADSFVGTAQYVSPELLNDKQACKASDLWALGCIVYQLLAGDFPFRAGNEYQTFKKITALEYDIPEGFPEHAKDLVEKLLVLDPGKRIGASGLGELKEHKFFEELKSPWDALHLAQPPELDTYLPARSPDDVAIHGRDVIDADIDMLLEQAYRENRSNSVSLKKRKHEEKVKLLEEQAKKSPWHGFCNPDELIIKTGLVDKRKGLFAKRRQLILTDQPRLFYMDPDEFVLKGEIPWSTEMHPEYKTPKTFFVHTPDRIYYLDDVEKQAITWVDAIQQIQRIVSGQT